MSQLFSIPALSRAKRLVESFESASVVDTDPLTPGENAIPVGTVPVDIATDSAGCHVVVANAGTCDLSLVDVSSVMKRTVAGNEEPAKVDRVPITAGGITLAARPHKIVAVPQTDEIGKACPEVPEGLVYIAYPECNWVAAVNAGTGEVVSGIRFADGVPPEITGGAVTCPAECTPEGGGSAVVPSDVSKPVALHMQADGSRLYIGAVNSNEITIVSLDENGQPIPPIESVALTGEVGIRSIHVTDEILMGGSTGTLSGGEVAMRFVYAIATDGTVRVASVGGTDKHECDAQIDPRYFHEETDIETLSCPDPNDATPLPRRPGATSPGIALPREVLPLSVTFAQIDTGDAPSEPVSATAMVGYFGFISGSNGHTYIVNIDDDRYGDFEVPANPLSVDLSLAIAHQLRHDASDVDAVDDAMTCDHPIEGASEKGPRLSEDIERITDEEFVAADKDRKLPSLRAEACVNAGGFTEPVSELGFAASAIVREFAFPDIAAVKSERWSLAWEGPISRDVTQSFVDGPRIRHGVVDVSESLSLEDPSRPYCAMGVDTFDIVTLLGCDSTRGDEDCGFGEVCFSDPSSSEGVTGLCFPDGQLESMAEICKDVLVSHRRYSVKEVFADRLVLGERRRILRTQPQGGCVDADQCVLLARQEALLQRHGQPIDVSDDDLGPAHTWACESDPTRALADSQQDVNRCVMRCDGLEDCEPGFSCSEGYCVSGVIPPAECMETLQRYEVRVSDAFAVIGSVSGFLHNRIVSEDTDACIDDPDGNALHVGRLPLEVEACSGDGLTDLSPNPCGVDVAHTDSLVPFVSTAGACFGQDVIVETRTTQAIRLRTPAMAFHLVDAFVPQDLECIGDNASSLPPISASYRDYELRLLLTGGLRPMTVSPSPLPAFPQQLASGPEGGVWLLDQGDVSGTSLGRVIRIEPTTAGDLDDSFSVESGTIL